MISNANKKLKRLLNLLLLCLNQTVALRDQGRAEDSMRQQGISGLSTVLPEEL